MRNDIKICRDSDSDILGGDPWVVASEFLVFQNFLLKQLFLGLYTPNPHPKSTSGMVSESAGKVMEASSG